MITIPTEILFEEVLSRVGRGESVPVTIAGVSMSPLLKNGKDQVVLSPLSSPLKVGDVALFICNGRYIVHRLIRIEGENLIFQGDNCVAEEHVRNTDVKAVASSVVKDGKSILCSSEEWQNLSKKSLLRKKCRNLAIRLCEREMRSKLRVWYFVLLAVLMWAPLNGLAEQFPNYLLGLRADHFVHASVYLFCAPFLVDVLVKRRNARAQRYVGYAILWLACAAIGIFTESVQYLLPYRGFDVNDIVANFCGATLGCIIVMAVLEKNRKRFSAAG